MTDLQWGTDGRCAESAPWGLTGSPLTEGGRVTLSFQLMGREGHGTFVIRSAGLQNVIRVAVCVCVGKNIFSD